MISLYDSQNFGAFVWAFEHKLLHLPQTDFNREPQVISVAKDNTDLNNLTSKQLQTTMFGRCEVSPLKFSLRLFAGCMTEYDCLIMAINPSGLIKDLLEASCT